MLRELICVFYSRKLLHMKKTFYDILNKIAKSQIDNTTDPIDNDNSTVAACCQVTWGGEVKCTTVTFDDTPGSFEMRKLLCEGPPDGHPAPWDNRRVNNNSPRRGTLTVGSTCDEVDCYGVLGIYEPEPSGPDRPEVDGESCTSICSRTMKDCIRQESIRMGCSPTTSADSLKRCLLDKYKACLAEKDPLVAEPPYENPCDYYFAKCDCDKVYRSSLYESYERISNCYRQKVGDCLEREDGCQKKLANFERSFGRAINSFDLPNCETHEQLCSDIDPTDLAAKCRNAKNVVTKITRDFDKSNSKALNECLDSKDRNDHCGRCECGKDHLQRKEIFDYQMCLYKHRIGCIDNAALARCEPDFTCFSRPEDCNGIRTRTNCKECREQGGQNPSGPMGPGITRPGRNPTTPRPTRPSNPTPTGPRRGPRDEMDG